MTSDQAGIEGLIDWLQGGAFDALITLRAVTIPSPSHRPRVTRWGTYYAKGYATYHADCLRQFAEQKFKDPITGRLAAVIETICTKPKTSKLTDPNGDSDNFAKGPLDAAKKAGVYVDDKQVVPLFTTRRWAAPGEEPGVIMHLWRL